MLNSEEKQKCSTNMELFEVLNDNFKPQHNETILIDYHRIKVIAFWYSVQQFSYCYHSLLFKVN